MVRDSKLLEQFERDYAATETLTIEQKYAILNAMYEYARSVGVWPPKDPLEGLDFKIRLAKAMNSV